MRRGLLFLLAVLLSGWFAPTAEALTRTPAVPVPHYDEAVAVVVIVLGGGITLDTFEGNSEDPLSLHRYLYCAGNPVNRIDPSGNMSYGDMGMAMLGGALVAGMFSCVADLALHRATTVSSLAQAMSWGAVLGPYAAAYPVYVGGGLGVLGLNVGTRTAYEVFTDKDSTEVQRVAALAMVVGSVYGMQYGQAYARNPRITLPRVSLEVNASGPPPSSPPVITEPPLPNPITAQPGRVQYGVRAKALRAGRFHLEQSRLDSLKELSPAELGAVNRKDPIVVSKEGVLRAGQHRARLAADKDGCVDVIVIDMNIDPGPPIGELPIH